MIRDSLRRLGTILARKFESFMNSLGGTTACPARRSNDGACQPQLHCQPRNVSDKRDSRNVNSAACNSSSRAETEGRPLSIEWSTRSVPQICNNFLRSGRISTKKPDIRLVRYPEKKTIWGNSNPVTINLEQLRCTRPPGESLRCESIPQNPNPQVVFIILILQLNKRGSSHGQDIPPCSTSRPLPPSIDIAQAALPCLLSSDGF
jgi:hypothetical protein